MKELDRQLGSLVGGLQLSSMGVSQISAVTLNNGLITQQLDKSSQM